MHALSCMHYHACAIMHAQFMATVSYVTNKAECFCYAVGILHICMYVCACIAICSLAKSDCSCHLLLGLLLVDTKTGILTIVKLMDYLHNYIINMLCRKLQAVVLQGRRNQWPGWVVCLIMTKMKMNCSEHQILVLVLDPPNHLPLKQVNQLRYPLI